MGRWLLRGAYRGAVLGLLLGIGWDTSRRTSLFEANHPSAHLTFGELVGCGVAGAVAGLVLATIAYGLRPRAR